MVIKESFSPAEFGCTRLGVSLSSLSCRFLCMQLSATTKDASDVLTVLSNPALATHACLRLEGLDLRELGHENRPAELV